MPTDADLVILGGGCAGLGLAFNLSPYGARAPRTLILEQRDAYRNDRTWCFWGDDATPFSQLAGRQWRHLRIAGDGRRIDFDCGNTPYRMLAADAYYAHTLQAISANPQLSLCLGHSVLSEPEYVGGVWRIETNQGSISAGSLVDTRPVQTPVTDKPLLWQSFCGHEIETAEAVFDPSIADLMDFSEVCESSIVFIYVLPVSETRALVEYTVFAASPLHARDLQQGLHAAIEQRTRGSTYTTLRSEYGCIPMGGDAVQSALTDSPRSQVRVGLSAGAARPATGYAFQRLQRWGAKCAQAMVMNGAPVPQSPDRLMTRTMDRLFLQVLRAQPALAPALFTAMFAGVDSRRLIRFLSDTGSLRDHAAVITALPAGPFLRHLFAGRAPA
ncbi:MAG: lycopene cyclase family protein [Arenimonas sp.]|uniref:lycopene cyclase family protein n=1 Tax=Arenimonas sp. TaxID=1872635 RepID=UPI003C057101